MDLTKQFEVDLRARQFGSVLTATVVRRVITYAFFPAALVEARLAQTFDHIVHSPLQGTVATVSGPLLIRPHS